MAVESERPLSVDPLYLIKAFPWLLR